MTPYDAMSPELDERKDQIVEQIAGTSKAGPGMFFAVLGSLYKPVKAVSIDFVD